MTGRAREGPRWATTWSSSAWARAAWWPPSSRPRSTSRSPWSSATASAATACGPGCVPSQGAARLGQGRPPHAHRRRVRASTPVEPRSTPRRCSSGSARSSATIAATDDDPERFAAMGIEHRSAGRRRLTGPAHACASTARQLEAALHPALHRARGRSSRRSTARRGRATSRARPSWSSSARPRSWSMIGGGPIAIELAQALHTASASAATVLQQRRPASCRATSPSSSTGSSRGCATRASTCACDVDTRAGDGRGRAARSCTDRGRRAGALGRRGAAGRRRAGAPTSRASGSRRSAIEVTPRGIKVDDRSRTSVTSIYAVGDLAGRYLFTHSAGYGGRQGDPRHVLPRARASVDALVPWCDVHRSRARPRRAHDRRGARALTATTSRCGAWTSRTPTGARADGSERGRDPRRHAPRRRSSAPTSSPRRPAR